MAHLKAVLIVITFFLSGFASAQELPENPQPVADRNFWLVTSANAAASAADGFTTIAFARNCPYESGNPVLWGRRPTTARESVVMAGLFAASTLASYELKKYNAHIWKLKLWTIPVGHEIVSHSYGTVHNVIYCH